MLETVYRKYLLAMIGLLLGACTAATPPPPTTTPTPTSTPQPAPTTIPTAAVIDEPTSTPTTVMLPPYFEEDDCFTGAIRQLRSNIGYDLTCGYLVVLENRDKPDGRQIKMPLVWFRSKSGSRQPDPVVYLTGGGGADQMRAATHYLEVVGDDILRERDFIMYNQRGAMYNEPELNCPGYTDLMWDLYGQPLSPGERYAQQAAFLQDCQDGLLAEGYDLTRYNTTENAADVRDLATALGYDALNIYGTSYGTRLGLSVIRDHPDILRSAIIDSVYPPQIDYYVEFAHNALRAYKAVFEACRAQPDCRERYPNLEATFYQVIADLNADPLTMSFTRGDIIVDGYVFMDVIYLMFYVPSAIPDIPAVITAAAERNLTAVDWAVAAQPDMSPLNWGVWWSLQCREEVTFYGYDTVLSNLEGLPPPIAAYFTPSYPFDICSFWQSGAADRIETEPVVSDVPTLVLAGHFDPITPPAWGRDTASYLSNSYFFEFPNLGHGVMRAHPCGLRIGLAFIDDPTSEPDSVCLDNLTLPEFR